MSNKISIIVAVFNGRECLENLLSSVINQINNNYELLIIDGGSKDNTIDIIKRYEDHISYWISEPDKGIYDAWNKGIVKATGDWIMFLGADDELKPEALNKYHSFLSSKKHNDLQYVSSRLEMIDLNGKQTRTKGWPWEWPIFLNEMTVAHPGSLHAKTLYNEYGLYNINYKITGDYEFLLRPRGKLRAAFMNEITVKMSEGGVSDSTAALKEHYLAATTTGGASKFLMAINLSIIYLKISTKKLLRRMGINAYIKR